MISLSVSTSRLSNWTTTRSGIVARSSGAMSISGAAVTSIPPRVDATGGAGSRRSGRRTRASAPSRRGRPSAAAGCGAAPARPATEDARRRRSQWFGRPSLSGPPLRPRGGSSSRPLSGSIVRPSIERRRDGRPCRPGSRSAARPQPGDAGRRVARAALVVWQPPADAGGESPGPPLSSPATLPEPATVRCVRSTGFGGGARRHLRPAASACELAHPVDEPSPSAARRGVRLAALAGRRKNSAKPPSASRSRRTMTESYVSSALATRSTSGRGKPERIAHLAHGRACPVGDEVADHPGVLGAVAVVDVLDDLLAPLRARSRCRRPG